MHKIELIKTSLFHLGDAKKVLNDLLFRLKDLAKPSNEWRKEIKF